MGAVGSCSMYMGYTLDLLGFIKVIFGSFCVFVSQWPLTRKRLTME